MPLRFLALFFCMFCACRAAEVVAWKAPLERYVTGGVEGKGVAKLGNAPEESIFFRPQDELWDLSKVDAPDVRDAALDWLVWNATSGRVVAKGSKSAMRRLHQRMVVWEMPFRVRLLYEIFPAVAEREFSGRGEPVASCTVAQENGSRARNDGQTGKGKLQVEAEVWGRGESVVTLHSFNLRFVPEGGQGITVDTAVTLHSGVPTWVAGDWNGKSGHDLRITATIMLEDGTPRAEMVLREHRGDTERINFNPAETKWPIPAARGYFVSRWAPAGDVIPTLTGRPLEDPFSTTGKQAEENMERVPKVPPPPLLEPLVYGSLVNLDATLRKHMGGVAEGEFGGYDPLAELAVFHSGSRARAEEFAAIFEAFVTPHPPNVMCILDGPQRVALMGKPGLRLYLSRAEGGQVISSTHFEPNLTDFWEKIEVSTLHETGQGVAKEVLDAGAVVVDGDFARLPGKPGGPEYRIRARIVQDLR
ncbi:hypothetical protein OVA24_11060 [Luteolibacter sp. SL250]|uniref:hypothetical protein n=1 Tax=Luteolibacter sp. SL250 TaxID=2995170 RepID=UPI0022713E16|nr:hypothetical protein [Luteolibacter sp. SL250]WAC17782.1 hypothetical protein OVA24_11060 [Luteolibacter sp. SL250]